MIKVDRPVVVEGKYDKSKLSSLIDAPILTTDGFGVFSNPEKLALIRAAARDKGIVILTDSDTAGFRIRGYLKGTIGSGKIVHVYIPDIYGKEKRKPHPSKEGKLGVEGVDSKILLDALHRAGVVCGESKVHTSTISKTDLYFLGLSGTPACTQRRKLLLKLLELPEYLSANALCDMLSMRFSLSQLKDFILEMGI